MLKLFIRNRQIIKAGPNCFYDLRREFSHPRQFPLTFITHPFMKPHEPAIATDDFIIRQSCKITADDVRSLRRLIAELDNKRKIAKSRGHSDLAEGVRSLALVLSSPEVTEAKDPLPQHLAEAGAALHYVLKGVDLIPDSVPKLGLADDEIIVTRVLQRNPELHEKP